MKKYYSIIVSLAIFLFMFIYFTQISPLVPFDGDDWRYIGAIRPPVPMWGVWNPTRVLPETLMGIGGYIGAFVVYPFNKNYVNSLIYVEVAIIVMFIALFFSTYYRLLRKRFNFTREIAIASELLFFISFFLLFKHLNQPSYNGFWTVDLACDFFYLIPGLLNGIILMYMEQTKNFSQMFGKMNNTKKGFFILGLYFTLFSNTQLTIIIAIYCFIKVVEFIVINGWKINATFLRNTYIQLIVLIVWLLTILFDLHGQRSGNVQSMNQVPFFKGLSSSFSEFLKFLQSQNTKVIFSFTIIILISFIIGLNKKYILKRSDEIVKEVTSMIMCLTLSWLYLLIAYAKAGSQYAVRPDAMWPVIFFFLLISNLSFVYLISTFTWISPLLPLLVVLLSLITFDLNYHQVPMNNSPYVANTAKNVDNAIIDQIVKADKARKSKVIVKVPLDQTNASPKQAASNWPHSYEMAIWLQNTLYSHRIIRTRMKIEFKPDKSMNKLYENKDNQQLFVPLE